MNNKTNGVIIFFECPCGFRRLEAEVTLSRFDYDCPKCNRSFQQFKKKKEFIND